MQAEEIRQGVASELLTCPEGFAVVKSYLLIVAMLYAGAVSAEVPTGDDYLVPRFRAGQTLSNVFSILRSMKADGYDEHVSRNGGSADDTVLSIRPSAWRFSSTWRYDGQAGGHDEEELRDGGRTYCSVNVGTQDKCSPYLEASGPHALGCSTETSDPRHEVERRPETGLGTRWQERHSNGDRDPC